MKDQQALDQAFYASRRTYKISQRWPCVMCMSDENAC
jgi:hypothetical protein